MKEHSLQSKNTDYTSSRVVLVEKHNIRLNAIMYFLTRTQLFSTEVIPLFKNTSLVYQESKKASVMIFGKNTSIVLVRVIILKQILNNNSSEIVNLENFNINTKIANTHYTGFSFNDSYFCFTPLIAIPASAKNTFINCCLNFSINSKNIFESIPIFRIPGFFSPEKMDDGTFLQEFKQNSNINNLIKNHWQEEVLLFKHYVYNYNEGLWMKINEKLNLNQQLNGRF